MGNFAAFLGSVVGAAIAIGLIAGLFRAILIVVRLRRVHVRWAAIAAWVVYNLLSPVPFTLVGPSAVSLGIILLGIAAVQRRERADASTGAPVESMPTGAADEPGEVDYAAARKRLPIFLGVLAALLVAIVLAIRACEY